VLVQTSTPFSKGATSIILNASRGVLDERSNTLCKPFHSNRGSVIELKDVLQGPKPVQKAIGDRGNEHRRRPPLCLMIREADRQHEFGDRDEATADNLDASNNADPDA